MAKEKTRTNKFNADLEGEGKTISNKIKSGKLNTILNLLIILEMKNKMFQNKIRNETRARMTVFETWYSKLLSWTFLIAERD